MGNEKERYSRSIGYSSDYSLYKDARTKVKVGTQFSEELEVDIGVHHG